MSEPEVLHEWVAHSNYHGIEWDTRFLVVARDWGIEIHTVDEAGRFSGGGDSCSIATELARLAVTVKALREERSRKVAELARETEGGRGFIAFWTSCAVSGECAVGVAHDQIAKNLSAYFASPSVPAEEGP